VLDSKVGSEEEKGDEDGGDEENSPPLPKGFGIGCEGGVLGTIFITEEGVF
jgi:hypothetical protein